MIAAEGKMVERKKRIATKSTKNTKGDFVLLSLIFLFFEQEIQAGVATSDLISSSCTFGNTS
jgi:hypothetical protein